MTIKPIKTERDDRKALKEIEKLWCRNRAG